ncbi:cytochrome b-c1 complex subunit 7 [Sodiomyces alkalinus F11]|uniref:Cytochrome b-c1 complex subunit 7 n=1 Tax=Sodiomyces alkalinus (strain CBS 110278 / VKM F-3762 / F11) TaxID=1314773 RepID=A0A3N2Q429_SODAK|nr:cytochrome b-c1 complex subunit 7 [Sodiomyces alkalinus F11]ROT41513.1 cytochrome b-c1 complex subunit 7 [Sodiomyces alkalinus F11]
MTTVVAAEQLAQRIAEGIQRRPGLRSLFRPLTNWYGGATGHRQLGLRFDDLLEEEREDVAKALTRLPAKEAYDRIYRIRRAVQCSYQQKLLPRDQWTKPEEDVPYLSPLVEQIQAEMAEAKALDTLEVVKKH